MTRTSWAAAAAVPLLLLLSACGPQPSPGTVPLADGGPVGGLDADAVAIRVDHTGGFVPPETIPSRLPVITIYGDGRVLTQGPVPAIYPGPALPNLQQARISPADVDALVQRALDAGVGGGADLGQPGVADATTTRIRVQAEDGVKQTEAYALEMSDGDTMLTDAQKSARKKLSDLLAALSDLPATLGAGAVTEEGPFPITTLAAIATPHAGQPSADLPAQQPVAWPGPALPGTRLSATVDVSCVTATGAEAEAVVAAARKANAATPWTSGGKQWSVQLRPILPDETGCDDLAKQG